MPDSENIGGISVDITASDASLDAKLDAAEAKIRDWVQRVSANVPISVSASTKGGGRAGGGAAAAVDTSALEKKLDTLIGALGKGVAADIRQAQKDASAVSIRGAGGAQSFGSINDLMTLKGPQAESIRHQLETALGSEPVAIPVAVQMDQRQVASEVQSTAREIPSPTFDTTGVDKAIDRIDVLSERLTMLAEQAREPINFNISDPTAASGGGGGGGRRRARNAAPGGDEEGGEAGNQGGRIAIQKPVVTTGVLPFAIDRSEAALWKQRTQEERAEARATAAMQRRMEQDARQAQAQQASLFGEVIDNTASLAPTGTAPLRAAGETREAEVAARNAEIRAQAQGLQVNRAAAERQRREDAAREAREPAVQPYQLPVTRADRGLGRAAYGGTPVQTESDIDLRGEIALARRQAEATTTQRTGRTLASGFGGRALGGAAERERAENELTVATQKRGKALKEVAADEFHVRDLEVKGQRNTREYADAVDQLAASREALAKRTEEQGTALAKVQSFSGLAAGARNLIAVTAAGAAFGLGLEAINVAAKAGERALAPYFDAASGYAQKTADLTAALADQARAQQGNAQGVTALRLAQSGFAASTAASIQPVIAQRAQVEAGNKAVQEQIDTFRVAEALRRQSATAGLGGGGTGGVLGTSLFGIPSTGEQIGNFLGGLGGDIRRAQTPRGTGGSGAPGRFGGGAATVPGLSDPNVARAYISFARGLSQVNDQLEKGGDSAARLYRAFTPLDARIEQTAQAFDQLSPEMAKAIRENHLYSEAIAGSTDPVAAATKALKAINLAGTLTGPEEQLQATRIQQQNSRNSLQALAAQQEFARPAFLASLERQQKIQIGTQIPAQAALANLAQPPTPVGTGIVARNAREQEHIKNLTSDTVDLQKDLDTYYAKGLDILKTTYQIPAPLLTQISAIGQQIASTQAGIANEQAQYQVAQINYQLHIARRTLSDIGGLTGQNFGAGQSYLGILERQNLALSRQAQMLQFAMSQRQINFQTAIAGFQVPGLTPAEQNARVEEARREAGFAQKQLDIQKQMFRNQVKIVDIGNLRQGRDLAAQIGLLLQGRAVTIDVAAAQQKLERLSAKQQILVQEAGTYISKVNAKIAQAEQDMTARETAAGRTIGRLEVMGVAAAYHVGAAFAAGITGGLLGLTRPHTNAFDQAHHQQNASGALFNTKGTTSLGDYGIAGEAGSETVAILRDPRRFMLGDGGGGGGDVYISFTGPVSMNSASDIEALARKITQLQGRQAALKGLRTPN